MSEKFDDLVEGEKELLFRTYGRYPISVISGKGSRLTDIDGKEYIDLLAGIAVTNLGHSHPEIAQTIFEKAQKLIHVSNLFYQEEQLECASALLKTCHFDKVFFCNSGAESNEAAIKLARRYSQRVKNNNAYEIITLTGAFHGRTLATVAATGQEKFADGFAPIPEGFKKVEWGDIEAMRAAITPKTAAVMIELIQGEGGIRPMSLEYAKAIENLCREKDILLICDEVQGGMGRTGKYWSFQHYDIKPDIISSSKALANGLPLGAIMATNEVAKGFVSGSHATTFGGGALVTGTCTKVLEIMERDNILDHVSKVGENFINKVNELSKRKPNKIAEVRGKGLMLGIVLVENGKPIWDELIKRGFILNLTQEKVLRLLPPLNIAETDLDLFLETLEEIL